MWAYPLFPKERQSPLMRTEGLGRGLGSDSDLESLELESETYLNIFLALKDCSMPLDL